MVLWMLKTKNHSCNKNGFKFFTTAARLERSSFFVAGNVLAKNSGSGRRISCPNFY